LLGLALPAFGQEEPSAVRKIEKVDVTGSHIPRTDIESALPLQIMTREEIERSGAITAAELLTQVSANLAGRTDVAFAVIVPAGLSSANLRGLGDGSTLVLINGRRAANYAINGGTVNLNFIPVAAIERVEVLKDGASAIYGADAMAGVINFILRKDFRGAQVGVYGADTEHGGGSRQLASATAGFGDLGIDRFNAFVTASYQRDTALSARDRSFSSTSNRADEGAGTQFLRETFPANIRIGPSNAPSYLNPAFDAGCMPPVSLPVPGTTAMCGHNTLAVVNLLPPLERTNVLGGATWQLNADNQLFAQYLYSNLSYDLNRNQTPASRDFNAGKVPLVYPADGPYYPTQFAAAHGLSGDLDLYYRVLPLGPIATQTQVDAHHLVVGAEGSADGWNYSAAWIYSRNHQEFDSLGGNVSTQRLVAAMATGLINPFGPSGPEGDALLASTQVTGEIFHASATTQSVEVNASRNVVDLPAGPLAIAIGGEARREQLEIVFPTEFNSGDVVGAPQLGRAIDGNRSVGAGFVELSVPVANGLAAQLAVRYDHYSDFGDTINPKVAVRWQPIRSLLLRASYGTGFRPPTIPDLYTPSILAFTRQRSDPARCPITHLPSDCGTFFPSVSGGKPDLEPETSKQFNAGVVWEPLVGLSAGFDYWKIEKSGTIGTLSEDTLFNYLGRFENTNVWRGPPEVAFPALPGAIRYVLLQTQNLGELRTSGFDVSAAWRGPTTPLGRFAFDLNGTYIAKWQQQLDGVNFVSVVGRSVVGPVPRWRHYLTLNWNSGPWGATLAQTFSSGYTDANRDSAGRERQVGAYDVWDLQGTYAGFEHTTIALGIKNLLDRDPPFSNQSALGQVMYDPRYADPRGRVFYAQLTVGFK
jgi:iron complex outermembrane receptor protein